MCIPECFSLHVALVAKAETFRFKLLLIVLHMYMLKIIRSLWSDVCTLLIYIIHMFVL